MKNYAKVIGFSFLLLFFCSLQSNTLAEDSFSPGSDWQEIPAYGPELHFLANWQGTTSSDNNTANDAEESYNITSSGGTDNATGGMGNLLGGLIDGSGTGGLTNLLSRLPGIGSIGNLLGGLMGKSGTDGISNLLSSLMGEMSNLSTPSTTQTNTIQAQSDYSATSDSTQSNENYGLVSVDAFGAHYDDIRDAPSFVQQLVMMASTLPVDNSAVGLNGPMLPGILSLGVTADFDSSTPGRETKWYSPLVIDTDRSGAITLDGGVIPFDIAPHLAGLETIPVPAAGKDMFLVWDKAGTETIEGTQRKYKEGEIIDITELFGPEDYTRSDFSVLAYSDDGFTKLRRLCDVDNDGDVDKDDTALSAEVAAKLKLWSPLSGELILFKDTGIVIDIRAGSYERHPSDIEGWAVEYKMKDTQGNLVGYEWLTSKTGSLLCVDVLLTVQRE